MDMNRLLIGRMSNQRFPISIKPMARLGRRLRCSRRRRAREPSELEDLELDDELKLEAGNGAPDESSDPSGD